MKLQRFLLLFFVLLVACSSPSGNFTSTGGPGFEANGTIFAYLDTKNSNGVLRPKKEQRLVVFMTWLAFSPNSTLSELDSVQLESMQKEFLMNDAMVIAINNYSQIEKEVRFSSNHSLQSWAHFKKLSSQKGAVSAYVFRNNMHLNFEQASFKDSTLQSPISARLEVWAHETANEKQTIKIQGNFEAELVEESRAKENLKILLAHAFGEKPDLKKTLDL